MTTASVFRSGPVTHVALLTLENPDKLGALDRRMREQLSAHWLDIRDDPSVRAVVLTGSGRGFSTGLDLEQADAGDDPATEFAEARELPRFGLGPLEHGVWKPYIVAVNGICAGGGFHLLSDADIVLASTDATFLDPHVSIGQVSALEPIALSRRIPLGSVLRMMVLGRHEALTADDALRLGLVSEVVEPERLLARAVELGSMAAQGSPAAIERSKRAVWESLECGLDEALQVGWEQIRAHWDHPDFREGITAYGERRAPKWETSPLVAAARRSESHGAAPMAVGQEPLA